MMAELNLSFAFPSQIKVLLLPIQPIRRDKFNDYCQLIKSFQRIPLRDIPPDVRGFNAPLSASPTLPGFLMLEYAHSFNRSRAYLEDLQYSTRVVAIIGVLDATEWSDLRDAQEEFNRVVTSLHLFPLATRCYAFDPADGQSDEAEGVVLVPHVGDLHFYMGTLLADLCASILHELSTIVQGIDQKTYIPSPFASHATAAMSQTAEPESISRPRSTIPQIEVHSANDIRRSSTQRNSVVDLSTPTERSFSISEAGYADKTLKRKMQGRVAKIKGDLRALAGRWDEALASYTDAAQIARITADDLWQAAALESAYLLQGVQLWAASLKDESIGVSTPKVDVVALSSSQSSEQMQKDAAAFRDISRIYIYIQLYAKNLYHGSDDATRPVDATPELVYAEACLRLTRLLLAVRTYRGWTPAMLEQIVLAKTMHQTEPRQLPKHADSSVSLSTISEAASMASSANLDALPVLDRIAVLSRLSATFEIIGHRRKQTSILWEIASLTADANRVARSDQFPQNSARPGAVVKSQPHIHGNLALIQLYVEVADKMGLQLVKDGDKQTQDPIIRYDERIESNSHFGWPALQVAVMCDIVYGAQFLTAYQAALRLAISTLRGIGQFMTTEAQTLLSKAIPNLFTAASMRGLTLDIGFWCPDDLVLKMDVIESPITHQLHVRTTEGESKSHRFIPQNDQQRGQSALKSVDCSYQILCKELTGYRLWPYLMETYCKCASNFETPSCLMYIFINSHSGSCGCETMAKLMLRPSTSDVDFIPVSIPAFLPAAQISNIVLEGRASATGQLSIRGVFVTLPGCTEAQEFVLPTPSTATLDQQRKSLEATMLDSSGDARMPDLKFRSCKIIETQPLLRLVSTSLDHGSLLLEDGERTSISITLENISTVPADYLALDFRDNLSSALFDRIVDSDGDLPQREALEVEAELYDKPIFTWQRESGSLIIAPKQRLTVLVSCLGKYGCSDGYVQVEYARSIDGLHARRITIPVSFTVRKCLHPVSLRYISPLDASDMLILQISNYGPDSFDVTFGIRSAEGTTDKLISVSIPAEGTTNVLLPTNLLEHVVQSFSQCQYPTSRLGRQFVLSTQEKAMSKQDMQTEIRMYWLRRRLTETYAATWHLPTTSRSGELFIGQLFDTFMLSVSLREAKTALEAESRKKAILRLTLKGQPAKQRSGRYFVPQGEFTQIECLSGSRSALAQLTVKPTEYGDDATIRRQGSVLDKSVLMDGDTLARPEQHGSTGPSYAWNVCFLAAGLFVASLRRAGGEAEMLAEAITIEVH